MPSGDIPKSCYFCQKHSPTFSEFAGCHHKICNRCLYQRIFICNIQDFKVGSNIKVKCTCEQGELEQTIKDIKDLLQNKMKSDEKNKKYVLEEDLIKCDKHPSRYLNYYCLECFLPICKECQLEKLNDHHCHRTIPYTKFKNIIQNNIDKNLVLKFSQAESFNENCSIILKNIQNEIEINFNNSLKKIDDMIKSICEFRELYIKKYKEELQQCIEYFKIIKAFYLNYYNDKNIAEDKKNPCNNINFLRYINNISYELMNIEINHNQDFEKKFSDFQSIVSDFKQGKLKCVETSFIFNETKRSYRVENILFQAHSGFITGLVELKNGSILSGGLDFCIKVFEEDDKGNVFSLEKNKYTIKNCGKVSCILYLKESDRIISGAGNNNNILVWELNENKVGYKQSQSLTYHDGCVSALAKMTENKFASGGADNKIVIWEEENKKFINKQVIRVKEEECETKHLMLNSITYLHDSRLVCTKKDCKTIYCYQIDESFDKTRKELTQYIFNFSKEFESGVVHCLCQLANGYIVAGGVEEIEITKPKHKKHKKNEKNQKHEKDEKDEKKENTNINGNEKEETYKKKYYRIKIWKPIDKNIYDDFQTIDAHKADINSVIELRDKSIASASTDRSIKIWKCREIKKGIFNFECSDILTEYQHGMYQLIQLMDDRLCSTSSDGSIIIWRNRSDS